MGGTAFTTTQPGRRGVRHGATCWSCISYRAPSWAPTATNGLTGARALPPALGGGSRRHGRARPGRDRQRALPGRLPPDHALDAQRARLRCAKSVAGGPPLAVPAGAARAGAADRRLAPAPGPVLPPDAPAVPVRPDHVRPASGVGAHGGLRAQVTDPFSLPDALLVLAAHCVLARWLAPG